VGPEELTPYFTEKPQYTDSCFIPNTKIDFNLPSLTRKDFNIKEDLYLMAAFGNVYKITPELFSNWMSLLKNMPKAMLWLIDDNAATTKNLKYQIDALGANLEQVLFTPRVSIENFRSQLKLCDIFLDNFPYNCGSTAQDDIQSGINIVTMSGKSMVSRMSGSILNSLDKNTFISTSFIDNRNIIYREYNKKYSNLTLNHLDFNL